MEHQNTKFCQGNPNAGDINYGEIAHGNDKSRNMANDGVIARLCHRHHAELKHAYAWKDWMTKGLMEHLPARDKVLTLAGVSLGSGVLHQEV